MKKDKIRNFAALLFAALLSVVMIFSLVFGIKDIPVVKEIDGATGSDGNPVSAICITDISELNTVTRVNYTPDRFLTPQIDIGGEIVDIESQKNIAQKGTYEFVVANLDPFDESFSDKSNALEPYRQGDNQWHFTLYIPACFSACNVYVRSVLDQSSGELTDYKFIDYSTSNYIKETLYHKSATQPLFIDLSFYTRRPAIPEALLDRAVVVTIHYEAEEGKTAGFTELPLIGSYSVISDVISRDKNFSRILSVITVLTFAVFLFACSLKRTVSFIPQILIVLGLLLFFLTEIVLSGSTALPYFYTALSALSLQLVAFGAILPSKSKKFSVRLPAAALALINCVMAFLPPYSAAAAESIETYLRITNILLAAMIIFFTAIAANKKTETPSRILSSTLAAAMLATFACAKNPPLLFYSSVAWLGTVILTVIVFSGVEFFVKLERQNVYLTDHLQSEIARQTKDLKSIVEEREQLLRYLSHDMKKPVRSIERFLAVLKKRENDDEQIKTIGIIEQKAMEIDDNLTELQKYSKHNYDAEQSNAFDAGEILEKIYEKLSPDCEANNVTLRYIFAHAIVFAKRNTLISVIENLVFNALEHSDCNEITLALSKRKGICRITVTDNGKGIPAGKDIFRPYYSESTNGENLGLGLYICKQTLLSMGGELDLEQSHEKTTFIITLSSV